MGSFNLAVMTYEKLMGFLVHQPDLLANCTTLVVDEVQSIGADDRGAKLEMLLTQVMVSADSPQVIALSASLDELNELDHWLRARLSCRPSGRSPSPKPCATRLDSPR